MTEIKESVEINRPPEEVFAYLDDVERHGEWQEDIVGVERVTDGPTRQGTRVHETRHVPGGNRSMTYEVTAHDPPRKSSFRVLDGPIRAATSAGSTRNRSRTGKKRGRTPAATSASSSTE